MSNRSEVFEDRHVFRGVNCGKILERARRRYTGEFVPVTRQDEEQTATTIYAITFDLDRQMRLELLAAVISGLISNIPSAGERAWVLECTLDHIRGYLRDAARKQTHFRPAKKNAGLIDRHEKYCGPYIHPRDVQATDVVFDRALRRRAGECLKITAEDLNGTYALLLQLMTEVDLIVLVSVTAQAIFEEYNGHPPEEALSDLEGFMRNLMESMDWMSTGDGLMH